MNIGRIKLVECPRDAMQGWKKAISTDMKVGYINTLLKVGFDTIDFGSFVSPKAIPQMADTREVVERLDLNKTQSKLLAIVANARGAEDALRHRAIQFLGFPFSVSETFQLRNANSTIEDSLKRVEIIQQMCKEKNKELVVYISMGFGNPYGDPYSEKIVFDWVDKLIKFGVKTISLADTVGLATANQVFEVTNYLVNQLPGHEIGVHLHSSPANWQPKLEAALQAGCRRIDGALKGIGGCPMANDELVGNMDTARMIDYFESKGLQTGINNEALQLALAEAGEIFN